MFSHVQLLSIKHQQKAPKNSTSLKFKAPFFRSERPIHNFPFCLSRKCGAIVFRVPRVTAWSCCLSNTRDRRTNTVERLICKSGVTQVCVAWQLLIIVKENTGHQVWDSKSIISASFTTWIWMLTFISPCGDLLEKCFMGLVKTLDVGNTVLS